MAERQFTEKQQFILDNPIEENESIVAWGKRLNSLNPNYSSGGFRNQIQKFIRKGILCLQRDPNYKLGDKKQNWVLKKQTTHPDGGVTSVRGIQGEIVDTSGFTIERVTTSPNGGQWVKYKNDGLSEKAIEEVINNILDRRKDLDKKKYRAPKLTNELQLGVIITDDHIGLDTNTDGRSLFPYKYDKDVYLSVMDRVFDSIMKERFQYGIFEEIVISGLGDLEDGWDKQTTRGGHSLPQNMSNDEVFDLAVDSRLELIKKIVDNNVAKKVVLRLVTNSNHSSSFAIVVAKSIKKICDRIYSKKLVEVDILYKFIEHRGFGEHCFLMCHGKDDAQMKGGLPHVLNDKAVIYINSYIDFHDLRNKYKFIHLWKGDAHRLGCTEHKNFDYTSFRALCPPSNWIGTNFGDVVKAGYAVCVVPKNIDEISMSHITVTYEKDI